MDIRKSWVRRQESRLRKMRDEVAQEISSARARERAAMWEASNLQKTWDHLNKVEGRIEEMCQKASDRDRAMREEGLTKLDGRIGNALERQKLAHLVGARKALTTVEIGSEQHSRSLDTYDIRFKDEWWAYPWFVKYAKLCKNRRDDMYLRLDELREATQEEIEAEIGLMLLEVL